jgi:exodeoxyribonuclease III
VRDPSALGRASALSTELRDKRRQSTRYITRYLEAAVKGLVVASIYLPNGNPQSGPKFDYKLAWFERLIKHAEALYASGRPVILAGDFNVVPTNVDIYNAWVWRHDAVMQPESRDAYRRLLAQGWTDATRYLHPGERINTFWVNADAFQRNAGFRMDFFLSSAALEGEVEGCRRRPRTPRQRAAERSCSHVGRFERTIGPDIACG